MTTANVTHAARSADAAADIELLTAGQVAKLLGVPKSWVYAQSREGRLPTVRLGRYYRYRPAAIQRWLAEREH
ncbi:MAG TPA: helix-turn-helix domain-containing protein [Solirubrobacteraceae bacterium]|jgi:excisionase family DNA binding protein